MKTLVVNLFGGPSAGKTTLAHRLVAALSMEGVLTEYVPEYAKELVWQNRRDLLDGTVPNQRLVISEQMSRVSYLIGRVEVVVTDSPAVLGLAYADRTSPGYADLQKTVVSNYHSHHNFDIYVNRTTAFDSRGRKHSQDESESLDSKIRNLLSYLHITPCYEFHRNIPRASVSELMDMICGVRESLTQLDEKVYKVAFREQFGIVVDVVAKSEREALDALEEKMSDDLCFSDYIRDHMGCCDIEFEAISKSPYDGARFDVTHCGATSGPKVVDDKYLQWTYRCELANEEDTAETWQSILALAKGDSSVAMAIIDLCEVQPPTAILKKAIQEGAIVEAGDRYQLRDPKIAQNL